MKQKDLMLVVGVALVAAIFAFILSGTIFGSPKKNPIKVPVVYTISSNFPNAQTDDNYKQFLNEKALNPTQLIQIGGNNNTNPFQNGSQ